MNLLQALLEETETGLVCTISSTQKLAVPEQAWADRPALSRYLGRGVTVGELWQGRANDTTLFLPADAGMSRPWALASTLLVAEDWLLGGLLDRRMFLSVTGAALARAVSVYLATQAASGVASMAGSSDDPLVTQIEASVPQLQLLDDERGGASGLTYVGAQVRHRRRP